MATPDFSKVPDDVRACLKAELSGIESRLSRLQSLSDAEGEALLRLRSLHPAENEVLGSTDTDQRVRRKVPSGDVVALSANRRLAF